MAEITNLSEVRRKRNRKRAGKAFVLILAILALTVVLSLMFSTRSEYGMDSFLDLFQQGEGYPVEAPSGKSKGMSELDGLLCVTSDSSLLMYNARGAEIYNVKHQMADPQSSIRDNMLLMFDQGAKSYALYQKNVPLADGHTDYVIYTGAVSSKGTFALATRSEDYLSQVRVYSKNGVEKYTWNYSDKIISAVALSPSGNKMAVSGLYTEDGTIKSQLLLYNDGELVDTRDFDNALICSLLYVGEGEIRGITDQGAFLISDKGKLMGEYDYKSQPLAAYCNTPESTVLLLGDYRQDGGYDVVALNSEMNRKSSCEIKGNIHTMKADSHNAYILAGSSYYQVDLNAGEILVNEASEYLYDLQPIGKGVFAITNEEIVRMEQVKGEERGETSVVPEQTLPKDELEDWEIEDEEPVTPPVEETPSEEVLPEETPVEPEEIIPESGTKPDEPGL